MPDEKPPPDPAELHANLVRTISNSAATAALLPVELLTPGHEFTGEMSAALKLTSVATQIYLGLEMATNATTDESRALGTRMARGALKQLNRDPILRHLIDDCPGEPEETPA